MTKAASQPILLPYHCRAARALLNLDQETLANEAKVSISSVKRFEAMLVETRPAMLMAMRQVLEAHGIVFVPSQNFEGAEIEGGVLLKKKQSRRR